MKRLLTTIKQFFEGITYMFLYVIEIRVGYDKQINKLRALGAYKGLETVNKSLDIYSKLYACGLKDSDVDKICKLLAQGKLK